ncbi:MAG: NlpC/P60 family protein [Cyanophyceae cyanobacterium]
MSEIASKKQQQYQTPIDLNLYSSPELKGLVTQGSTGRFLIVKSMMERSLDQAPAQSIKSTDAAVEIQLLEDGYCGWISSADHNQLMPVVGAGYRPVTVSRDEIVGKIPGVIAFAGEAMTVPNKYLWGGTTAPNYDCSGLVQAAFASVGVWLPRDSYQQEAWTKTVEKDELEPGDLIFFSQKNALKGKIDHVALFIGNDEYIHSSGYEQGRGGIAIDSLSPKTLDSLEKKPGDSIAKLYASQVCSFGRIVESYNPRILNVS